MAQSENAVGSVIQLGEVSLVRTDTPDRMKELSAPDADLMMVVKDFHGCMLCAKGGDFSKGVLQISANNEAIGYWMPQAEWMELQPGAVIKIKDVMLVRHDDQERMRNMAQSSKTLHVLNPDWHGYTLMATEGDVSRGLLMVNKDNGAVGFWMPKPEYEALNPTA
uniref:Uncharacterized protein n=1 Tax=Eutreptiella gymnastica TaxID=73025 RepID=A0A7S1J398_9EUGL|mmetsp:Transcript_63736/g.113808  ORF Transcript_63736/g.113808 Transcript_63736/m.113808 type:complete len:165 (+) Transcript_63736:34-528(+)